MPNGADVCKYLVSFIVIIFVFARSLLQLFTLSVDATGIGRLLSFYFFVGAFAVVVELSLFLVMHLLLQLCTSTIEGSKMRELLTFGAFITP